MTSVVPGLAMSFGGDTGRPVALVTLKSIGLAKVRCPELSKAICAFVEKELSVSPDRTFIDFTALDGGFFGWNGKTF